MDRHGYEAAKRIFEHMRGDLQMEIVAYAIKFSIEESGYTDGNGSPAWDDVFDYIVEENLLPRQDAIRAL